MPKKKDPAKMTSEELVRHLFHPKVVEHAKKIAREAESKGVKRITKKSI
jgi:hypothetical protein